MNVNATVTKARDIYTLSQTQQLPFLAAAIAYYAFLSVVPLLIVGVAVATALADGALAEQLLASLDGFLTPEGTDLLEQTLIDSAGRSATTALGLVVLLWSALRVFRGLDIAFSRVYGSTLYKSLLEQLRDALVVFVAVSLAIGGTVAVSALLSLVPGPVAGFGSFGLLVVLPVIFFPLYYVFPASDVTVREALPGAFFAGLCWTVLGALFGIYAAQVGSAQLYGVLGGVLLLLVWFYFGGLVLLLGAALNAVLAGRFGDRQLQQGSLREKNQRKTMTDPDQPSTSGDDASDSEASGETADPLGDEAGAVAGRRAAGDESRSDRVTQDDLEALHERLGRFEDEIEDRTVHRTELESELKRYVRKRSRRGHARGWGPYLVLGYGTAMTLGAFFFLGGGWAVLAMVVIWLSTLGLYALMIILGITAATLGIPGRVTDRLRSLRKLR